MYNVSCPSEKPNGCCMILIRGGCYEYCGDMWVMSDLHTLCKRSHCFQCSASPGTGSYTWLGRIWEFMNHKGINR